jgi:hypothetical protein
LQEVSYSPLKPGLASTRVNYLAAIPFFLLRVECSSQ